jgi:hypothetical protein
MPRLVYFVLGRDWNQHGAIRCNVVRFDGDDGSSNVVLNWEDDTVEMGSDSGSCFCDVGALFFVSAKSFSPDR